MSIPLRPGTRTPTSMPDRTRGRADQTQTTQPPARPLSATVIPASLLLLIAAVVAVMAAQQTGAVPDTLQHQHLFSAHPG